MLKIISSLTAFALLLTTPVLSLALEFDLIDDYRWDAVDSETARQPAFGQAVVSNGKWAVAGAPNENDFDGQLYLFQYDPAGPTPWQFVKPLDLPEVLQANRCTLGTQLAMNHDWIVASASRGDCGAALYYRHAGGENNWGFFRMITAADTEDRRVDGHGEDVTLSGDLLAVSAPFTDYAPFTGDENQVGEVFIYRRDAGGSNNWGEVARISIPSADQVRGAAFGLRIALDQDRLIVGSEGYPGELGGEGRAWLFEQNLGGPDNWGLRQTFSHPEAAANVSFGSDVSISGDVLVVGANRGAGDLTPDVSNDGAVFVYEQDAGGPEARGLVDSLVGEPPVGDFGGSVDLEQDMLMVGSGPGVFAAGGVWLYRRAADATWPLAQAILQPEEPGFSDFGNGIDLVRRGSRYVAMIGDPQFLIEESTQFFRPRFGKVFFYHYTDPTVVVDPAAELITSEQGGAADVSLRLSRQPSADVTLEVVSTDATEGLVMPSSLTFTPLNWDMPQLVTVSGQDDLEPDQDVSYAIVVRVSETNDLDYLHIGPVRVGVVNLDDDILPPNIVVSAISGDTSESGRAASFTVRVVGAPTADVVIGLSSSNPAEGTLSTNQLVFSQLDPNTLQRVTVVGQDDDLVDGDVGYRVEFGASSSADPSFLGLSPAAVEVINLDNELAP